MSAEFTYLLAWLKDEAEYQYETKFSREENDRLLAQSGLSEDGFWWQQLSTYLGRLRLLGIDNPNGRQAAAKFAATVLAFLESVVRVHGPLPEPGVPSGENLDHLRPLTKDISGTRQQVQPAQLRRLIVEVVGESGAGGISISDLCNCVAQRLGQPLFDPIEPDIESLSCLGILARHEADGRLIVATDLARPFMIGSRILHPGMIEDD